jgi:hypothetical protein
MYRLLYWLLLRHLPAEGTHRVAFAALRMLRATPGLGALLAWWGRLRDPDLGIDALGLRVPVGPSAWPPASTRTRAASTRCSRSASASSRSAR